MLLLIGFAKLNRLSTKDAEDIAMLNAFVPLLTQCLRSRQNRVVALACRCFVFMVRFPLPLLSSDILERITKAALRFVGGSNEANELRGMSLKLLTALLTFCPAANLTSTQLVPVMRAISDVVHSHELDGQSTVFAMLKAILTKRLLVEEIYDAMDEVAKLMVTASLTCPSWRWEAKAGSSQRDSRKRRSSSCGPRSRSRRAGARTRWCRRSRPCPSAMG